MKIYQIVIALSLIIFSYQVCEGSTKKEDCKLSDEEKKQYDYCCFVEDGDKKHCEGLTKYQYKHIKDYGKMMMLAGQAGEDTKIDCNSIYLQLSIISSLLLLLF